MATFLFVMNYPNKKASPKLERLYKSKIVVLKSEIRMPSAS